MSKLLRRGCPVEEIIEQAKSIRPCNSYTSRTIKKGDTSKGTSCPSAIGFALEELNEKIKSRIFDDFDEICEKDKIFGNDDNVSYKGDFQDKKNILFTIEKNPISETDFTKCKECGEVAFVGEGGCGNCKACGYSPCG